MTSLTQTRYYSVPLNEEVSHPHPLAVMSSGMLFQQSIDMIGNWPEKVLGNGWVEFGKWECCPGIDGSPQGSPNCGCLVLYKDGFQFLAGEYTREKLLAEIQAQEAEEFSRSFVSMLVPATPLETMAELTFEVGKSAFEFAHAVAGNKLLQHRGPSVRQRLRHQHEFDTALERPETFCCAYTQVLEARVYEDKGSRGFLGLGRTPERGYTVLTLAPLEPMERVVYCQPQFAGWLFHKRFERECNEVLLDKKIERLIQDAEYAELLTTLQHVWENREGTLGELQTLVDQINLRMLVVQNMPNFDLRQVAAEVLEALEPLREAYNSVSGPRFHLELMESFVKQTTEPKWKYEY